MEAVNHKQLLSDPEQFPDDKLFQSILDNTAYDILGKIAEILIASGLTLEWRYYKDGKAWLGKVTHKGKTILWLSVWDGFMKASFYFTEKTRAGVLDLDIDNNVKSSFAIVKPIGKLIPLVLEIKNEKTLNELKRIIDYKKSLNKRSIQ